MFSREQVGWLRSLISEFAVLRYSHPKRDEDPLATAEMTHEVSDLADNLDMMLDQQEQPQQLPTAEEVDAMAKAAGMDEVPF
jgi:hypothetical protein